MENKIAFVILHYITVEDTKKCVESIKNMMENSKYKYEIIVVDNHSDNGTGEELESLYQSEKNMHVIINKQNLGFARGNNVGFKFAKEKLKCNFIIMLNNDTYILQKDFGNKVVEEYDKYHYGVLGPKIVLKNVAINPIRNRLPSIQQTIKTIWINRVLYILTILNLDKLHDVIKGKLNRRQENKKKLDTDSKQENIILHGCCLIFSPQYVKKFDGIDNRTFLYCEEELLYIRILENKWKTIYDPNLIIYHMEDGATNAINQNNRKKRIFKYKNAIKSKKILYKELKKYYANKK